VEGEVGRAQLQGDPNGVSETVEHFNKIRREEAGAGSGPGSPNARHPKDYIKAALDGKAAGTQIVLTATVDGVDLVAVGWKQSRTSDQFFITTRGVCSTRPDPKRPHVQTWLDANIAEAVRRICRMNKNYIE